MRTFALGLGLALLASACTGRPDDPVFVFGAVVNDDGVAVVDAPVSLWRGSGQRCGYLTFRERGDFFPAEGDAFTEFTSTRTGDDGLFLFKLFRFQVEPQNADFPCFRAWVEGGPTGARTLVALNSIYSSDVEVDPVYRLDGQTVSFAADGEALGDLRVPDVQGQHAGHPAVALDGQRVAAPQPQLQLQLQPQISQITLIEAGGWLAAQHFGQEWAILCLNSSLSQVL